MRPVSLWPPFRNPTLVQLGFPRCQAGCAPQRGVEAEIRLRGTPPAHSRIFFPGRRSRHRPAQEEFEFSCLGVQKRGKMAKKRILIIDDEEDIRDYLREILEDSGFEVVDAANGLLGQKLFRQNPTDLIITDILMPEKGGFEAILELHREFPEVKIFAISGGGRVSSEVYLEVAKDLGAIRTFVKPVNAKELIAEISNLFQAEGDD